MSVERNGYNIDQHRILHAEGKFQGFSIRPHVEQIAELIEKYEARSMLDYGSGKGLFHREHKWGIPVRCYDPAVEWLALKPTGRYDAVICTDVMEHIPESGIDAVLAEIDDYARKFSFLSICTREARKKLPNGENCHLTIRPESWWLDKLDFMENAHVQFT